MAGINLNNFAENATRLGMRLQESFSERTRDLSLARPGAAAYLDTGEDKVRLIRKQLDSSSDREKLEAMKRLLALVSKGRDASEFFAQVVKNVAVPNVEVRKLVYIYLLRYADTEPDLALLSINTFQRDLSDSSPLIRAMALRVLAGIQVPSIGSLLVLAIKKSASDVSPYVRKNAALAIPKCYRLDDSHLGALIDVLQTLLRDRSPVTLGAVAVAFEALCPTRLDLLHPHYRRLCRSLADADEWGQVDLLDLLVRYARTMLPRPFPAEPVDGDLALLTSSAELLLQSRNPAVVVAVARAIFYLAPIEEHPKIVAPLVRLLDASPEIERVVLTYIHHITHTSPQLFSAHYTRFLVRADDSVQVKLSKMRLLRLFVSSDNHQALLREFIDYVDDDEDALVEAAVFAIGHVARTIPESTQQCLNALMTFIKSQHEIVVTSAVLVLKSIVQSRNAEGSSVVVHGSVTGIVESLARRLDEIRHPAARACVVWLVGQHAADPARTGGADVKCAGVAAWAPDVLRQTVRSFCDETAAVKLQTLTLGAKLLILSPADRTLGALTRHALALARFDANYDVRDRARFLQSLLTGAAPALRPPAPESWDDADKDATAAGPKTAGVVLRDVQVRVVLFEGKTGVSEDKETFDDRSILGSATLVVGKDMHGDRIPPEWLEHGIDPALREDPFAAAAAASSPVVTAIGNVPTPTSAGARNGGARNQPIVLRPAGESTGLGSPGVAASEAKRAAYDDLDAFYASSSSEEEEDGEEEDDEEEDDGEEEEEEDEDEEGGSDEDDDGSEHEGGSEDDSEDEGGAGAHPGIR